MKTLRRIGWWCILLALIIGVLFLWRIESGWASSQDHRIEKLGAEIWTNPMRWEDATVEGTHAINWQKELYVGHGILRSLATWKQLVLAGLSVYLGATLAVSTFRKRAQQGTGGNR
jgi:hypothetical protein